MKTIFRLPAAEPYAYAQIETSEGSPQDNARELRDVDASFLQLVGNVLHQGCTHMALGQLQPHVISETAPAWDDQASMPAWASPAPQEAQGYAAPPQQQQYNQAQSAPQGGYGAYQAQAVPQQPNTPPGQSAPVCQFHSRPAEYKPAGVSQKTNRPYNAFWACAARDNNCTKASNFPRL